MVLIQSVIDDLMFEIVGVERNQRGDPVGTMTARGVVASLAWVLLNFHLWRASWTWFHSYLHAPFAFDLIGFFTLNSGGRNISQFGKP